MGDERKLVVIVECEECGHATRVTNMEAALSRAEAAERDNRRLREALAWWGCGKEGGLHRGDHTQAAKCRGCQALAAPPEGATREDGN